MRLEGKELLLAVREHILKNPESLDMGYWIMLPPPGCGTVACIAGWCVLLADVKVPVTSTVMYEAEMLLSAPNLRIPHSSFLELFHPRYWKPKSLFNKYERALTQEERVAVVAERIDYFIKEHYAGA